MSVTDSSGLYIQLEMNHQNHFRHSKIPEDILDCLRRNRNAEHIRIISTENYGENQADQRKERDESYFLNHFKNTINYLYNLRTLYLETFAFASINYFPGDPLLANSRMEGITVINRRNLNRNLSVNIYVKQVYEKTKIKFHGINLEKHVWAGVISARMDNWKNMEELGVEAFSQLSYVMSVSSAPNSLKSLDLSGVFVTCDDFKHVCLNCPKLDTLALRIREVMRMSTFWYVRNLKNLNFLDLKINYYFSREQFVGILVDSEFSNLFVCVTEYQSKVNPDTVVLKDGLITIIFNGGRDRQKIVNPHSFVRIHANFSIWPFDALF